VLFFRPVPPPALLQLARTLEPAAASPGQVIVAQGHLGTALYVILAGTVAAHRTTAEAPGERIGSEEAGATEVGPQVGTPLQAGDAFGEEALLQAEG
jgi:CRP-like cAMP-binding protein